MSTKVIGEQVLQHAVTDEPSIREEQNQEEIPARAKATQLHAFPRFPQEIRNLIWKFALPGRIHELSQFCGEKVGNATRGWMRTWDLDDDLVPRSFADYAVAREVPPHTTPCSVYHACKESRDIVIGASKQYEFCFGFELDEDSRIVVSSPFNPEEAIGTPDEILMIADVDANSPGIEFDPMRDTIYIPFSQRRLLWANFLAQWDIYHEFKFGNIRSIAYDEEILSEGRILGRRENPIFQACFEGAEYFEEVPGSQTGRHFIAAPWFEGLEEFIVVSENEDREGLRLDLVRRIAAISKLKRLPIILVLSQEEFGNLTRWS